MIKPATALRYAREISTEVRREDPGREFWIVDSDHQSLIRSGG